MNDLFRAMSISGSALTAERLRMDTTASNLANANTAGYRRKEVVLQQSFADALGRARAGQPGGVVAAAITDDQTPNRRVLDPTHPDADADGYISLPNVNTVTEMVDLISASRAYDANVTALQTAKAMFAKTLELLK